MCSWGESRCGHLGIMSHATNGESAWFCREHWERNNNREPLGRGNELPTSPKSRGLERYQGWEWSPAQRRLVPKQEKKEAA
jgi:hypothetical protein